MNRHSTIKEQIYQYHLDITLVKRKLITKAKRNKGFEIN